jgi:type IV pilus assembly protein PilE
MREPKLKNQPKGFTLIELMVVIIVISILAAFAIPGYMSQLERARRAEGIIALELLSQQQEKFFSQYRTYTGVVSGADGCAGAACGLQQPSATTDGGFYTITAAGDATSFTLTATAAGGQVNDDACGSFSLTNTGIETATNSSGAATTACW